MTSKHPRTLLRDPNLIVVFSVTLMAVMGVASITPVFPRLMDHFAISSQQVGWLVSAFTLPGVVLTPVLGIAADRYGRKRILVPSLVVFAVAGAACAAAPSFQWLLALRLVQGAGSAALGSLNVTLIGDLYAGPRRSAAMGYNGSVLSVGTASYPALGGARATLGWQVPFLLPALGAGVALLVLAVLDNPEPREHRPLGPYLRSVVASIREPRAVVLFAVSLLTFILLFGAFLAYMPVLLDERFEASTLTIGLVMSTSSVVTAITSSQLHRLRQRFSERQMIAAAFGGYLVALVAIPLLPWLGALVVPVMLFGLAQGLNFPNVLVLLSSLVPLEQRGAFMSFNGMVLRAGQTLGPLLAGAAVALSSTPAAFFGGAAVALLALPLLGRVPARADDRG